jgi:hypothetical protein
MDFTTSAGKNTPGRLLQLVRHHGPQAVETHRARRRDRRAAGHGQALVRHQAARALVPRTPWQSA